MEGRVLNTIPVDLADVEVGFHFGDVGGGDAVGGAPDAGGGGGVLFCFTTHAVRMVGLGTFFCEVGG